MPEISKKTYLSLLAYESETENVEDKIETEDDKIEFGLGPEDDQIELGPI